MTNYKDDLLQAVVEELDTNTSVKSYEVFKEISSKIDPWRDANQEAALPDELRWEIFALNMKAVSRKNRQENPDERFRFIGELPTEEQAVDYYRERIQNTPNPVRKARYGDLVWIILKQQSDPDHYQNGIEAAEAYLAQVPICVDQRTHIELADGLDRAAEIAILLNNQDLAARVVDSIFDTLQLFDDATRSRWVRNLGYTLLYVDSKFSDLVTPERWQQIKGFCDDGIAYYTTGENRNLYLAPDLMELATLISEKIGDDEAAWGNQIQIAEFFVEEARRLENEGTRGSKLNAYKFMENAMHFYLRLLSLAPNDEEKQRVQEKIEETKREVRRLIRLGQEEMVPIGASFQLSQKEIDEMMAPLLVVELEQVLEQLRSMPDLLLEVDQIRRRANEASEKYLYSRLFGNVSLRDGRKVDETQPDEDETAQFLNHLNIWFQVHSQILDIVLHRLREEGRFTFDSFMVHFRQWELLDETDVPFIEVGLERYFADDFISALHVLTPRIEHILKSAFEQAGLPPVAVPNQRQIREQTFGDFLRREEVKQALGDNIWHYLYYLLVDERSLNIRNDVAHGWIAAPACDRLQTQMILFTILLLTGLRRTPRSDDNIDPGDSRE